MSMGNIHEELQQGHEMNTGSVTWDPGEIADGNEEAKEITVVGAAIGDQVIGVSFSLDVEDLVLNAQVTGADVVTAVLVNNTGGTINLGSGTVRVTVMTLTQL